MKKIFILTGEPSGDKLASKVISKLQKNNLDIEYSCVGGIHLNALGIKSIRIGKSKFTSDDLLPEKSEIIFLSFDMMLDKSILLFVSYSNNG